MQICYPQPSITLLAITKQHQKLLPSQKSINRDFAQIWIASPDEEILKKLLTVQ
jgi:hypothetical protein